MSHTHAREVQSPNLKDTSPDQHAQIESQYIDERASLYTKFSEQKKKRTTFHSEL